jgi:hypothetical protein
MGRAGNKEIQAKGPQQVQRMKAGQAEARRGLQGGECHTRGGLAMQVLITALLLCFLLHHEARAAAASGLWWLMDARMQSQA